MKFNPNVLDCAAAPIAEAWSWVTNPQSENLIDMCQAVPAHLPPQLLRDYLGDAIKQVYDSVNARYGTDIQPEFGGDD